MSKKFFEKEVGNIEKKLDIFKEYPDVVTIEDLQSMLHIGRNAAYKLLKDDTIKTLKIGKKYIIPKISVINYIASAT